MNVWQFISGHTAEILAATREHMALVLISMLIAVAIGVPLGLALCSANGRTIVLAMLLTTGALGSWYFWLWQPVWSGLALLTVGFPLLIWGWLLFFWATWMMTRPAEPQPAGNPRPRRSSSHPSRPSWGGHTRSWPSWPARRK